jgi:hypothetical protein
MDALLQDIRYGIRQLLRQRGSSIVAVLTLALGIGASAAIFSVVDAAMLRRPYPNPEQLVTAHVAITQPDGRVSTPTTSMADMRLWQQATDVFSRVAGSGSAFRGRIVDGPEPERIEVSQFTEDYLSMHGVTPLIGRDFTFEDTQFGAPSVVLLGYGFWQSRYADVIGVVGVFGMTAYAVSRRTAEIGVRMAFGARPGQVVRTIVRDSAVPIAIGAALGLGGTALVTRVIESFLFETTPTDTVTFAAVTLTLVAAGCLAALVPAMRAARVDPVATLRVE